jgi:hypothetical protein
MRRTRIQTDSPLRSILEISGMQTYSTGELNERVERLVNRAEKAFSQPKEGGRERVLGKSSSPGQRAYTNMSTLFHKVKPGRKYQLREFFVRIITDAIQDSRSQKENRGEYALGIINQKVIEFVPDHTHWFVTKTEPR